MRNLGKAKENHQISYRDDMANQRPTKDESPKCEAHDNSPLDPWAFKVSLKRPCLTVTSDTQRRLENRYDLHFCWYAT